MAANKGIPRGPNPKLGKFKQCRGTGKRAIRESAQISAPTCPVCGKRVPGLVGDKVFKHTPQKRAIEENTSCLPLNS